MYAMPLKNKDFSTAEVAQMLHLYSFTLHLL